MVLSHALGFLVLIKEPFIETFGKQRDTTALNWIVFAVGMVIVGWSSVNAIRTFMLPGATNPGIGRAVFRVVQLLFLGLGKLLPSDRARAALFSVFGPVSLLGVYITLIALNGIGFAFMFWSLGERSVKEAMVASGSSLSTLGFASFTELPDTALSVVEAMATTTISALLIGYLPSIFSSYLTAEQAVHELESQVGNPDCGPNVLATFNRRDAPGKMDDFWDTWSSWFAKLGLNHGSLVGTLFLRSPQAGPTWVQAASAVLDAAALQLSVVDQPQSASAQGVIDSGATALLRSIGRAGFVAPSPTGAPETDAGVTRAEFDAACTRLAAAQLPLKDDRDAAWHAFAAHRARYAAALAALSRIKGSPFVSVSCESPAKPDHLHLPIRRGRHLPHAGA
jgi:hypothetical protein